jgi:DNA-binding NtrC family response regulator
MDLYHRLNVIEIFVPSLNDRRDDIPLLANYFLVQICNEYKRKKPTLDQDASNLLMNHNWTGNIRELRNVMERLVILCDEKITTDDIKKFVFPA